MAITNVEKKLHVTASDIPSASPLNDNDQCNIAIDSIQDFELVQMLYNFKQCSICNESRLEMKLRADNVCHRCVVNKNKIKMFSFESKMDPGLFPVELKNLSAVEQELKSRQAPIMHIHVC